MPYFWYAYCWLNGETSNATFEGVLRDGSLGDFLADAAMWKDQGLIDDINVGYES